MKVLDVIATFAPYAFVLPFVWVSIALVVAAFRVRHTQPRRKILSLFGNALFFPFLILYAAVALGGVRNLNEPVIWLVWYAFIIFYSPLLIVLNLTPRRKTIPIWQPIGYTKLMDFLLLRPVPIDSATRLAIVSPEDSTPRHPNLPPYLLMLGISTVAAVLSFVGNSLQTCEWLDIATGRSGCLLKVPLNHDADEIALSPDGRVMATSSWGKPLRLYNVADGTTLRELPSQFIDCGQSVSFSADNQWVATISNENVVTVSDVQTGAVIHALKPVTDTYNIRFSPDGKYLAVSLGRAGLQLWRTDNWKLHWMIAAPIFSLEFSVDGRWLAARTDENRIGIWQMTDGTVYRTINTPVDHWSLAPDGSQLVTADLFGPIKVWDVPSGQVVRIINADTRGKVFFSVDGQYLLSDESYTWVISHIDQLSVWRIADGRQVGTFPAYFSIDCAASATKSNVFAYSDWKSLRVFRLRQD